VAELVADEDDVQLGRETTVAFVSTAVTTVMVSPPVPLIATWLASSASRDHPGDDLCAARVDGRVAGVERGACGGGVVCAFEQVGVDLEGDAGVGVAELAADEGDVEAFRDQQRCVAVPERVQRQPFADDAEACAFEGLAEVFATRGSRGRGPGCWRRRSDAAL
jgi:hypothetical protein